MQITAIISKNIFLINENFKFYQITSFGEGALDIKIYFLLKRGYGDFTYPNKQFINPLKNESPYF
jgi:hypothetical protein